jgi:hypothetical protein
MAKFSWPDWLPTAPELPPPPVDPHRIEGFTNRFIAASQDALHDAPDAFFGKSGADAVEAAPAVAEQLSGLRDATLDLARNEPERQALADRLERYHSVARDDIDRHVAAQRQVLARQTIGDRQALNLRAAGLRHNEDVLLGLVADIMFRRNGTSYLEIVEVKSGEAKLSPQQAALLAEALKTGDVYIASEEKAEELEIRPNVTSKQKIQPWVTVTGGEHAIIVRQLMDHGVDVGGRRSRFRLGVPPN